MHVVGTMMLLAFWSSVAHADEAATSPAPSHAALAEHILGGLLVGSSATMASLATRYGVADATLGGISPQNGDSAIRAAVGLAVGAAVTEAIGIPLIVAGTNADKSSEKSIAFGFAPSMGSGGALVSRRVARCLGQVAVAVEHNVRRQRKRLRVHGDV